MSSAYAALPLVGLTRTGTFSTSPRMRTADMISNAPMTIRQTPTARANVTIDANGAASTIIPASKLRMPKKTCHPRAGSPGWLICRVHEEPPNVGQARR